MSRDEYAAIVDLLSRIDAGMNEIRDLLRDRRTIKDY
jgi:hypothetical protein